MAPREPVATVAFIDQYCSAYQHLFPKVRSYESFKFLQLGMISNIPRKSLPAIANAVGLTNDQSLHHFLTESPWNVATLQKQRLSLIQLYLRGRAFTLVIDDTGDKKKGKTTDYVARQYIGNLNKLENGIVCVSSYGILGETTFPLIFKVFKPQSRLQPTDIYKTKAQLVTEIIQELQAMGFLFEQVLVDSIYGESDALISILNRFELNFILAIRSNNGVWFAPGQRVRTTKWKTLAQSSFNEVKQLHSQEVIFGKRFNVRYWYVTTDPVNLPKDSSWFLMSNLSKAIHQINDFNSLDFWINYEFKHRKNQLGWADFRLTSYEEIEKWWELVYSAYLMINLQTLRIAPNNSFPHTFQHTYLLEKLHQHLDSVSESKHISKNI